MRVAPGLGAGHLAALVAACHRAVPEVEIDLTEQATADQIQDLLDGRAGIGVLREPFAARGLRLGPRVSVPLNCLVPSAHPAASAGRVRLRDLAGHGVVLPPRDLAPAAHDDIVATCERHGFLADTVREVADDRFARGLVAAGSYVGFTTDHPGGDDGTAVVSIDDEPLMITLRPAWRNEIDANSERLPAAIVGALVRGTAYASPSVPHRLRAVSELPVSHDQGTGPWRRSG